MTLGLAVLIAIPFAMLGAAVLLVRLLPGDGEMSEAERAEEDEWSRAIK